jgi:hypothetical protein
LTEADDEMELLEAELLDEDEAVDVDDDEEAAALLDDEDGATH